MKSIKLVSFCMHACMLNHLVMKPYGLWPTRLLCPWDSQGKNPGVGSHFLLQWIFPTQESSPDLLHCRQILYQLSYEGSPITLLQTENITIVKVVNSGFSQERALNVMLFFPPYVFYILKLYII